MFEHTFDHTHKEVGVFEVAQQAQIDDEAEGNKEFSQCFALAMAVYKVGQEIIAYTDDGKHAKVKATTFVIEVVREGCNEEQAGCELVLQAHVNERETQEKHQEESC